MLKLRLAFSLKHLSLTIENIQVRLSCLILFTSISFYKKQEKGNSRKVQIT